MENVKHHLNNIIGELTSVVKEIDKAKKPVATGREIYLSVCGYDRISVYDNKDDLISEMIDQGEINDYDTWFDDLTRDEIADYCEDYSNCTFREAMEKAYDKYCLDEFEEHLVNLDSSDESIRRADGSAYIRVHII